MCFFCMFVCMFPIHLIQALKNAMIFKSKIDTEVLASESTHINVKISIKIWKTVKVLDLTIFVSHKRPFQENTEACFNNVIVF